MTNKKLTPQEEIAKFVSDAEKALYEAERIADLHDLGFSWEACGYGMGGYYDGEEGEWRSSSESC